MNDSSNILVFSLSGFGATVNYRVTLFSLTLLCYCLIVLVNVSLILTITLDQNLHEPMYIFLFFLCINGLYGTIGFFPKFVFDLLSDVHVISYVGCLLQVFLIYSNAKIDYSILVLMAYDRYVAICRPLEYHSVMSVRRTAVLVSLSWLVPLFIETTVISLTSTLKLCDSHIDKLYCENWSIVKLACGSTKANDIFGLIVICFYFCHALFIACSYVWLIKAALKSREGRRKFTQTCVPHMLCLLNVTTSLLFDVMYSRYGSASLPQNLRNFMAIQFLIMTPSFNPIIYGLVLQKIRNRMISLCSMAAPPLAGEEYSIELPNCSQSSPMPTLVAHCYPEDAESDCALNQQFVTHEGDAQQCFHS
uniref:olfactory receptor 52J3-like n=1 Tax=Semicossyphus pulcher TaxID=241346 RepID=UPI0037E79860